MRILAALSGGVDSALAAALLKDEGHEVLGVHLRTGVEAEGQATGNRRSCCGADDARDARAVAARLEIPFYVLDVSDAFAQVLEAFESAYVAGRTPNPCVDCNRWVKFGRLLEVADDLGAEAVATGHYARREVTSTGRVRLLEPADRRKDQTYVLYPLTQEQLRRARFPLGGLAKTEVRSEAARRGLPVAGKPDSQDLCFVPGGDYRAWLKARTPAAFTAGPVVDEGGREIGRHEGAAGFTVGQRRGLPAVGEPRYVTGVEPASGVVYVAPRAALARRKVAAHDVNWIDVPEPERGTSWPVRARVRHGAPTAPAMLTALGVGRVEAEFDEPVFAPAPGQAFVAYREGAVLCGGILG